MSDLPFFIEFLGSFDTRRKKEIDATITPRCRPEEESIFIGRELGDISIEVNMGRPGDIDPGEEDSYNSDRNK